MDFLVFFEFGGLPGNEKIKKETEFIGFLRGGPKGGGVPGKP